MLKKTFNLLIILLILITCIGCNKKIKEDDLFTYYYDFSYYGFENVHDINLKATNLDTLTDAIDNKKTAIFTISSSTCLSCKKEVEILNDISKSHGFSVYLIDPYSHLYPLFDEDEQMNKLLDILKPYIKTKDDLEIPLLIIVNDGDIVSCMVGTHDGDDTLFNKIDKVLKKSNLY